MLGPLVSIILFGYPLICVALFLFMPARKAATVGLVVGFLFLPEVQIQLPALMSYNKILASVIGPLIGLAIFEPKWLMTLRLKWIDLPMGLFCISPFFTAVAPANMDLLGPYEGLSASIVNMWRWGLPYLLGRAIFCDRDGLRILAMGVFWGGLLYLPFCLYEIRMSPQLHENIWGFRQHSWSGMRLGGYRPSVFLEHGMALGLWMSAVCIVGVMLWWSKAVREYAGLPMLAWVGVVLSVTLLCRSTGALMLLAVVITTLRLMRSFSITIPVIMLALAAPIYMGVRIADVWEGEEAVSLAETIAGRDRSLSLAFRLKNERALADHTLKRPVVGWGRMHDRARPKVPGNPGDGKAVTDGMWVVIAPQQGFLGLLSLYLVMVWPVFRLGVWLPPSAWFSRAGAPAGALGLVIAIYILDSLVNAPTNPVFMAAIGGLVAVPIAQLTSPRARPEGPPKPPA